MKRFSLVLSAAVLSVTAASAQAVDFSSNFDGATPLSGWTVSNGAAVSTAQSHSASDSLFVPESGRAIINVPNMSGGGVLTAWVFDQGNWATTAGSPNANGWRVGITASTDGTTATPPTSMAMILVDQRSFVDSTNYSYSTGDNDNTQAPFGGFFSPNFNGVNPATGTGSGPGTSRQVVSLSPTSDDGSAGVGEWTQWEFDFDGTGNVSFFMHDQTTGLPGPALYKATLSNPVNSFFVYGGGTGSHIGGVFVDDIAFTAAGVPEPASLALLALGAGSLLMARRRRH